MTRRFWLSLISALLGTEYAPARSAGSNPKGIPDNFVLFKVGPATKFTELDENDKPTGRMFSYWYNPKGPEFHVDAKPETLAGAFVRVECELDDADRCILDLMSV